MRTCWPFLLTLLLATSFNLRLMDSFLRPQSPALLGIPYENRSFQPSCFSFSFFSLFFVFFFFFLAHFQPPDHLPGRWNTRLTASTRRRRSSFKRQGWQRNLIARQSSLRPAAKQRSTKLEPATKTRPMVSPGCVQDMYPNLSMALSNPSRGYGEDEIATTGPQVCRCPSRRSTTHGRPTSSAFRAWAHVLFG
ncbi:hypothetical protein B0J18DRAFT_17769 [Chaetomium sp. MPI-SDFR-AT-0129]|nr:hypothetical protein B0J18DRAFT_17769 [Chaetomium sp. MPI-SDFR-AT-0129]